MERRPVVRGPRTAGHDQLAIDNVARFVRVDLIGASSLLAAVIVVELVARRGALLWSTIAALALLVCCLVAARRIVLRDPVAAIALVAIGHAVVAIVVPIALPFLWPVLVLSVVVPLVLAAPHVPLRSLLWLVAASGVVAATSALIGLRADDAGAVPDIDDDLELVLVVSALALLMVPIGLVVWQNHRSQRRSLDEALRLNEELARSRRRVVEAGDDARRRIERDLHDGAQQRLVAIALQLRALDARLSNVDGVGDVDVAATVHDLHSSVEAAIAELRDLAHGVYPPVLTAHGLGAALAAIGRSSGGRVTVDDRIASGDRPPVHVEQACYFAALEAIANASKYAPDGTIVVTIDVDDRAAPALSMAISDDGPGFDTTRSVGSEGRGDGLDNMADRIESVGGVLVIDSAPGVGTTIRATVPLTDRRTTS